MTAEIAVMNKEAVALAADSAATMDSGRGPKIFTSANKIYALSLHAPVAVMVYGGASLLELPWETAIKLYRQRLADRTFGTLDEYANDFLDYLENSRALFPVDAQERHVAYTVFTFLRELRREIESEIRSRIDQHGSITDADLRDIVDVMVRAAHEPWKDADYVESFGSGDVRAVRHEYGALIKRIRAEVFKRLPFTSAASRRLADLASLLFVKVPPSGSDPRGSGVVVAGFGDDEIFPGLHHYFVEGISSNRLKAIPLHHRQVSRDMPAVIVPFAQSEMVVTFMEGIDPALAQEVEDYVETALQVLTNDILDEVADLTKRQQAAIGRRTELVKGDIRAAFAAVISDYRNESYTQPIIRTVAILPKDELAEMAESLVNLTSFKRRVSDVAETVGGPIDVAVISKGDGLVWIKRKHYFDPGLNPRVVARLAKGVA